MGKYDISLETPFRFTVLRSVWDFNWNSGFATEGELHEPWEIVYVVSGSVRVTEDSRIYDMREGDMIIHAPREFHNIKSALGTSPHVYITAFGVDGSLPEALKDGVFSLSLEEKTEFISVFRRISRFYNDNKDDMLAGQECMSALASFLIRLGGGHKADRGVSLSRSAAEYNRIAISMQNLIYDNATLEEIARLNNISISNMKVLFKKYCGIGPKKYYDRLRCTEAIRLLESGQTAASTAAKMGFSSAGYFCTFFKRMTGTSPISFVKK